MTTDEDQSAADRVQDALMGALLGILMTVMGAYFAYPRDLATKEDIAALSQTFQQQYDRLTDQQRADETRINALEISQGAIREHIRLGKQ